MKFEKKIASHHNQWEYLQQHSLSPTLLKKLFYNLSSNKLRKKIRSYINK